MSMTPERAQQHGMTIEEYVRIQFIAAALQGILANPNAQWHGKEIKSAFEAADDMLKAGWYIE